MPLRLPSNFVGAAVAANTGFVGQSRTQDRFDAADVVVDEVGYDALDSLVSVGRFFEEQIAIFTDDDAAERSAFEIGDAITITHTGACIAARPFSAGAVRE